MEGLVLLFLQLDSRQSPIFEREGEMYVSMAIHRSVHVKR
jgi:hypothetical protein